MGEALVARRSGGNADGMEFSSFYTPSCDVNNSDIRLYTDDTNYSALGRQAFANSNDRIVIISNNYYYSPPSSNVPDGKRISSDIKFTGFSKIMAIFSMYGTLFRDENNYATGRDTVVCLCLGEPLVAKRLVSGVWHEVTMELCIDSSGYLRIKSTDTTGTNYSMNSNQGSPFIIIAER